jgi:hypothetical protein
MCRRRQRYKHASMLERPPQRYGHRLKLAEVTSPRGLTSTVQIKLDILDPPAVYLPNHSSPDATVSRRWPWRTATSTWPKQILPHPPTPSVLSTAPKAREVRMVKSLHFPVRVTRERATGISCFPCQTATRSFLRCSAPPRPFSTACSPPPGCFFA